MFGGLIVGHDFPGGVLSSLSIRRSYWEVSRSSRDIVLVAVGMVVEVVVVGGR